MIGVELRTHGRFSSNLEDGNAHLHTTRIVVRINLHLLILAILCRSSGMIATAIYLWSAVAQLVECRTRIPVVTISKFGHFLSLHDASVDSAV